MILKNDRNGKLEIVINDDCNLQEFIAITELIADFLNVKFTNKMGDLHSQYWDFMFDGVLMTIHHNVFIGISIFAVSEPSPQNNETTTRLFEILHQSYFKRMM
jgi:hypothetical protein